MQSDAGMRATGCQQSAAQMGRERREPLRRDDVQLSESDALLRRSTAHQEPVERSGVADQTESRRAPPSRRQSGAMAKGASR